MVLIISEDSDTSTNIVMSYLIKQSNIIKKLNFYGKPSTNTFLEIENLILTADSIWLRRGNFDLSVHCMESLILEKGVLLDLLHFLAESHPARRRLRLRLSDSKFII